MLFLLLGLGVGAAVTASLIEESIPAPLRNPQLMNDIQYVVDNMPGAVDQFAKQIHKVAEAAHAVAQASAGKVAVPPEKMGGFSGRQVANILITRDDLYDDEVFGLIYGLDTEESVSDLEETLAGASEFFNSLNEEMPKILSLWFLMQDPSTPLWLKGEAAGVLVYVIGAIAYLVSPVDLIPEAVVGPLGYSDDALALYTAWKMARYVYDKAQPYLKPEHLEKAQAWLVEKVPGWR
jgi:uncharacterized membrane protein YkvA (DUF1232 family)